MALNRSCGLFISFMREDVMMITSSDDGINSLMQRYTMRRRWKSLCMKSLVTLKKTSDDSAFVNVSPCVSRYSSLVMTC